MAALSFVTDTIGSGLFVAFVGGLVLFTVGIVWLVWISAFTNREYSNDKVTLGNRVTIATLIALTGIVTFSVSGMIMAAV